MLPIVLVITAFAVVCDANNDDNVELIRGRSGKQQIIWRNQRYTHRSSSKKSKTWECVNRGCRAHLTTTTDCKSVLKFRAHNHGTDESGCEAQKVRSGLIDAITSYPNQPTTKLCRMELVKLDPACSAQLPNLEVLARSLRYYRGKQRPPLPKCVSELVLPETLTTTKLKERFLLYSDLSSTYYITSDAIVQFLQPCLCHLPYSVPH
jgi:hypothetical protein